jgi:hypothetical protein
MSPHTSRLGPAVLLALAACGRSSPERGAPAAGAASAPVPAASAASAPSGAAAPVASAPADPPASSALPLEALGRALAAAASASTSGATSCDRAYAGIAAMVGVLERAQPAGAPARPRLPAREAFLSQCAALPPALQACLEVDHAMKHAAECQLAEKQLDPKQRAKLATLLGK